MPLFPYTQNEELLYRKDTMHYAEVKYFDVANGPGIRVSLFVSGCPHACPGCFNEIAWNYEYGEEYTEEVEEKILKAVSRAEIQGLSLLGGEPLYPANLHALLPLLRKVKERFPKKDIWCYSGYTYEELLSREGEEKKEVEELFSYIAVLVDGRFIEAEKDITLLFRGSRNQRLICIPETRRKGKIVLYGETENSKRDIARFTHDTRYES